MKRFILGSGFGAILTVGLVISGCDSGDSADPSGTGGKASTGGNTQAGTTGGSTTSTGGSTKPAGGTAAGGNTTVSGGSTSTPTTGGGTSTPTTGGLPAMGGSTAGTTGGASAGGAVSGGSTAPQGGSVTPGEESQHTGYHKPRIIASTDAEGDDKNTMVRFLMYASDFDIVGINQSNSRYQKKGHSDQNWIQGKAIAGYGVTYPNLKKHNPDYPDPAKILATVVIGNENEGDLFKSPPEFATKDTAGSDLMIKTLLDNDPRPVHLPSWGGANTTAWAYYKLKTTYKPEELKKAAEKAWIYCIWYQDNGGKWIEQNIPEAKIYEAFKWDGVWDYNSYGKIAENKPYMDQNWYLTNVGKDHGPLGEFGYSIQKYVSEGDTPSFLPLVNNGLNQHLDYTWGGWGGRPVYKSGNKMVDGADDGDTSKAFYRWIIPTSNDFAARMDWGVATEFSKANHHPKATVKGGVEQSVAGGATVTLDASGSTDPDNNELSYKWWQYADMDSAAAKITITGDTTATASFTAPSEPGKQIHVILEVKDNGTPPLIRYQRIIVTIK